MRMACQTNSETCFARLQTHQKKRYEKGIEQMKQGFLKAVSVLLSAAVVTVTGAFLAPEVSAFSDIDDFEALVYKDRNHLGKKLPYRLYIPPDYDESKSYPLLVYLHGVGERGDDNYTPISWNNSLARKLAEPEYQKKYPSILLVPQCPADDYWCYDFPHDETDAMQMLIGLIQSLAKTYHVDQNRLYITGFSNGGGGVWDALFRYPGMFAAGVPMSGYSTPWAWERAAQLKDVPLQVYHCNQDPVVDVSCSRGMVNTLKAAGSTVQYHEIDSADHGFSMTNAYYDEQLLPWLFSQKNNNTFPKFVPQGIKGKDFLSSSSRAASSKTSSKAPASSNRPASSKPVSSESARTSSIVASSVLSSQEEAAFSSQPVQSDSAAGTTEKPESTAAVVVFIVCAIVVGILVLGGAAVFIIMKLKQ